MPTSELFSHEKWMASGMHPRAWRPHLRISKLMSSVLSPLTVSSDCRILQKPSAVKCWDTNRIHQIRAAKKCCLSCNSSSVVATPDFSGQEGNSFPKDKSPGRPPWHLHTHDYNPTRCSYGPRPPYYWRHTHDTSPKRCPCGPPWHWRYAHDNNPQSRCPDGQPYHWHTHDNNPERCPDEPLPVRLAYTRQQPQKTTDN